MDPRELRECQEGNTGDAQGRRRRMVLDIDLNHCPPDENIFNSLGNQGQATNVIEVVDDDDVVVISPRKFAEATQNSRRNHRLLDGSLEDCLVISDHRPGNPDPRTALRPELLWNTQPLRRAQNLANTLTPTPTFTCGICMDELTEETSTKCGHIFCKKCIDAAIAAQHKCPSCRQKLNKRDTLRVYLPKSG